MVSHDDSYATLVDILKNRLPQNPLLKLCCADSDEAFDAALEEVLERQWYTWKKMHGI